MLMKQRLAESIHDEFQLSSPIWPWKSSRLDGVFSLQVAVVEASSRIGGRVRTWQGPGGVAVDAGAQWIENEGADGRVNPIYALTQQLGIATVPNKCASVPSQCCFWIPLLCCLV